MSTALWLAAICQGFLALVDLWQDRLLYFPQRATVEEVAIAGLTPWPSARDFRGLVLITPWGRLAQVASHHYPWLPVKWLLRDPYDTAARLARLDRPMVVIVAEQDSIVPARFGGALNAAPDGPKYLMQIEGAGHNDWPGRVDATWWRTATGPAPRDRQAQGPFFRGSAEADMRRVAQVRSWPGRAGLTALDIEQPNS